MRLRQRSRRAGLTLPALLGVALLFWLDHAARSENFVFYLPQSHQVVPLQTIEGSKYLPLFKVLNLAGAVGGFEEKRKSIKITLGDNQLELHRDDRKVRLNKTDIRLEKPVRYSNGVWLLPVDFLYSVLPKLTQQTLAYRLGEDRMFLGGVQPVTYSTRLEPTANGARLMVSFSGRVAVESAASNGKWIVFVRNRPVQPLESSLQFNNPYVAEVRFDDQDGAPKLIITPGQGTLDFRLTLGEDGRELQADVVKPGSPVNPPATTAQGTPPAGAPAGAPGVAPSAAGPGPVASSPTAAAQAPAPPSRTVVLDAGHGGPDDGARSRDGVLEKNLVAQLVSRVQSALEATRQYRVVLTRPGDSNPSFDDRDAIANGAHAVAFITFHAGELGSQSPKAMVYTDLISAPVAAVASAGPVFVPWVSAQAGQAGPSGQLASALAQQLGHISGLSVGADQAPVRQLRSVNAPAAALELGSLSPNLDAGAIATSTFQDQIARAVVNALAGFSGGKS